MFRLSFLATLSLVLSSALPATARPVCYMDYGDIRIDLSYMCSEGDAVAQQAILPVSTATESTPEEAREFSASFEYYRSSYIPVAGDSIVEGAIVFGRSAHVGDSVSPVVYFDGREYVGDPIVRERGRNRYPVTIRLPLVKIDAPFQLGTINAIAAD